MALTYCAMRTFLPQLAGSALLALSLGASAAAVEVRDVRLWAGPDSTRVVFDLSGSARHRLSVLKSPARIVLDMPGAHARTGGFASPGAAGAVKQLRFAQRPGGNLRIVIDLAHAVRANSFLTAPNDRYGYRLVVDLAGAAATAPVAAPGPVVPVKVEHAPPEARDLIIAIDAGHGGEDPGAIGIGGTRE